MKTTTRQEIIRILRSGKYTLRDLSQILGDSEKKILSRLTKIDGLVMSPPLCIDCGFVYKDRDRASKPSKCPECRSTHISYPIYTIE